MTGQQFLTWDTHEDGLVLVVDDQAKPVPSRLVSWFREPMGTGITTDPAHDVLRLEAQLRRHIGELRGLLDGELRRLARINTAVARRGGPWWSWAARRHQRADKAEQAVATESVAVLTDGYAEARHLHHALREYVVGLGVTDGPLGDAAAGWQRSPAPPVGVMTFADEATFLAADPRRAVNPDWPDLLAGTVFGSVWRRDGDDNPDLLERGGTWQVGHILATGEIYATRRGRYVPPAVWLLGKGFTAEQACALLLGLEYLMGQPNSLPLVAAAIRVAAEDVP